MVDAVVDVVEVTTAVVVVVEIPEDVDDETSTAASTSDPPHDTRKNSNPANDYLTESNHTPRHLNVNHALLTPHRSLSWVNPVSSNRAHIGQYGDQ